MDWQPISTAPFGLDIEVCVFEKGEPVALVFPCHRTHQGWVKAGTQKVLNIAFTHWRRWPREIPNPNGPV
jgi:hypothetical protein